MPVFPKFDGVDGESKDAFSEDSFVFKSGKGEPDPDPKEVDDFSTKGGEVNVGLLLPAVQRFIEPSSSDSADPMASEDLTIDYVVIEWTY